MIVHIFKDGTTTTELKDVYVPAGIVERIHGIVKEGKKNENKEIQNQGRQLG